MADGCLLYYITDRTAFAPDEPTRRRRLLDKIAEASRAGVDYIQLREKDLSTRALESLARDVVSAVKETQKLTSGPWTLVTTVLINSRTDIALAARANGVHLRSDDICPNDVRSIWNACSGDERGEPLIGVSSHSPVEVAQAQAGGATFAVFAPVFEKKDTPITQAAGLTQLREACKVNIPVLALGGVTLENAKACLDAGASGIAAIRLFQEHNIEQVARLLRQN